MASLNASASLSVSYLVRDPSDHAPLLISCSTQLDNKPRTFRFLNMWTSNASLLDVVKVAWQVKDSGSPFYRVWTKLQRVSRAIQLWNKETFGDVFLGVRRAEAAMARAELQLQSDTSDENVVELQRVRAELRKWRYRAAIHRIRNLHGTWLTDDGSIGLETVRYFEELFSEDSSSDSRLLHVIPNLSSEIENIGLEEAPSLDEVKNVVFSMDGDSTAGPGWVHREILYFCLGGDSVCNFLNKVISRVFVSWLTRILPCIISPQQSGFVPGRNMSDNYLLTLELIADIGKKCRGRNVVFKLDMAKAYDRMS
ncbi:uncharacterized protein [Coffea arabica]|uniref:Reverse transcriptase domain-containing protein n=1 Tax=Coffea arabica TaxID=13443 RepID=A0ABM4WPG9_COFAR